MFRVLLDCAFLAIVVAWILAEVLSIGRSSDERAKSELASDDETDPATSPHEFDFGPLLAFAMILAILYLLPSAVISNGQSLSLHDISDSVRASMDVGTVAPFVGAWRAEYPLGFWGFFAGLPVAVIWLFRRSPALLGVAVVAALFIFWLKIRGGISIFTF